jgi:hypothetical protein
MYQEIPWFSLNTNSISFQKSNKKTTTTSSSTTTKLWAKQDIHHKIPFQCQYFVVQTYNKYERSITQASIRIHASFLFAVITNNKLHHLNTSLFSHTCIQIHKWTPKSSFTDYLAHLKHKITPLSGKRHKTNKRMKYAKRYRIHIRIIKERTQYWNVTYILSIIQTNLFRGMTWNYPPQLPHTNETVTRLGFHRNKKQPDIRLSLVSCRTAKVRLHWQNKKGRGQGDGRNC